MVAEIRGYIFRINMSSNDQVQVNAIHIFKGENNFAPWLKRIKIKLAAKQLTKTIESNTIASIKDKALALDIIVSHLDDNVLRVVPNDDIGCPAALIKKLNDIYNSASTQEIIETRTKLQNLKFSTTVPKYFEEFFALINRLDDLGEEVTTPEQCTWILNAIPNRLCGIRGAASGLAAINQLTVPILRDLLKNEENLQKMHSPYASTFRHTPKAAYASRESKGEGNYTFTCFRCKEPGHLARNCPEPGDNFFNLRKPKPRSHQVTPTAATATFTSTEKKSETPRAILAAVPANQRKNILTASVMKSENAASRNFVLDSGCTQHITNCKDGINIRELKNPCLIDTANKNQTLKAPSVIDLPVTQENRDFIVKDALYAPDAPFNLLGVRPLTERGLNVTFYQHEAVVRNEGGDVLIKAQVRDDLYYIDFQNQTTILNATCLVAPSEKIKLWHRRLGHTSPPNLSVLVDDEEIGSGQVKTDECDICCRAKQNKNPYMETRRRATRILEIVHTDIIGPFQKSIHGENYIASFMDDFTHYTITFALHNRSDIAQRFEEFEKMATAKFGVKIHILRCDNALEITAGRMRIYCDQAGIIQQPAERYEHQHNGRIERFNRTLLERTRALLYEAKMPAKFWSFAMYAATYIINRSPTSALQGNGIPYEKWFGMKPNLKYLRVFGSLAHVLIPYETRTKLEPKSVEMVIVGYTDTGYLVLNPSNNETIYSSNVRVDETKNYSSFNLSEEEECEIIEVNDISEDDEEQLNTVALLSHQSSESELTYEDVMSSPECEHWIAAMEAEKNAMKMKNVFVRIPRSSRKSNVPVITMVWTFKKKKLPDGSPLYKARLCARGCNDPTTYEQRDTYAPVIKFDVLRLILVLAAQNGWHIKHVDVSTAYLNSDIEYEIYAIPPPGYDDNPRETLFRIDKSMYGLRTAAKDWYRTLKQKLEEIGFKVSKHDPCVFIHCNSKIIISIYVDDFIFIGPNEKMINDIIHDLENEFTLKNLGTIKKFLGIDIKYEQSLKKISLSQAEYVKESLVFFGLDQCNTVKSPMETGLKIVVQSEDINQELLHQYRAMIGRLLYISNCTRPDITYAVNYLSRYQTQPTSQLMTYVKRIFRYLKGTLNLELTYEVVPNAPIVEIYSDSDYAGDITDRKSTTGLLVKYSGCVIDWCTRKQRCVTLSSAEAEYLALSAATAMYYTLKYCLQEIGIQLPPAIVHCDSSSAISIAETDESKRSRHVDVAYHNIRDAVVKGDIILKKIASANQLADIFTKSLTPEIFQRITYELLKNQQ